MLRTLENEDSNEIKTVNRKHQKRNGQRYCLVRFGVGHTEGAQDRKSEGHGLNSICAPHCHATVSKIPNISGPLFSKTLKYS